MANYLIRVNQMRLMVLICAIALSACSHKNDDGSAKVPGGILGTGKTSTHTYRGAITTPSLAALARCGGACIQTVTVNYNHNLGDQIYVNLCANTDCSQTVPPTLCSQASPGQACYTTIPSNYIFTGENEVGFVNAFYSYSNYSITTVTTH